MERFGVRIAGRVPDPDQVARIAAPILGMPSDDVSSELARSGQLVTALSREQADRLVNQLGDLGLEVFVAKAAADESSVDDADADKTPRNTTDPLHGLTPLQKGSGLASALVFDDDVSRPSIGTAPPVFVKPPSVRDGIAADDEYDDADEPSVGQTGVMLAPSSLFLDAAVPAPAEAGAPGNEPGGLAGFSSTSPPPFPAPGTDEVVLVKPPRVSPSRDIPLIRDPFESDPSQAGLPPPEAGAPLLSVLPGDDLAARRMQALQPPAPAPARGRLGGLLAVLVVVALGVAAFMLLRGDDPENLVALARDATATGQYDRALDLIAKARAAGGDEAVLRPVMREAQAGPLLDAGEGHMAAGSWGKARATFEAAQTLAPGSVRAIGLILKLERLSASKRRTAPASTLSAGTGTPRKAVAPGSAAKRAKPPATTAVAEASAADDTPRSGDRLARLLVRAPVQARVYVDGRSTGQLTPTTIRLPPGDHEFELRDQKTSRVLASRSVRAIAGRSARVDFELRAADIPKRPKKRRPVAKRRPVTAPASTADVAPEVPEVPVPAVVSAKPERVEMIGAPASDVQPASDARRIDLIGQ